MAFAHNEDAFNFALQDLRTNYRFYIQRYWHENRMNARLGADRILELSEQFNRFAFEHPEILDGIPDKAVLALLDADDPDFNRANLDLAATTPLAPGSQRVYVEMQTTGAHRTTSPLGS